MDAERPLLGVMIGDPGGISPEVCLKALATGRPQQLCVPVLVGNRHVLEDAAAFAGVDVPLATIEDVAQARNVDGLAILETGDLKRGDYQIGEHSAASGDAVWEWKLKCEELSRAGALSGWVMAPINSDSIYAAGHLDDINDFQPKGTYMLRVSGPLRVVPLSEHILLRDVPDTVTPEKVAEVVDMVVSNLRKWGLADPRVAVAGINPHASFKEDVERISPAIESARAAGINAIGPVAPDSVFRQMIEGRYDVIVTMYHDQGQIAVKTTAFAGACTIFMGLPYVMIGITHGSAYDIAGKGVAQHRSMLNGLMMGASLAAGRGFPELDG